MGDGVDSTAIVVPDAWEEVASTLEGLIMVVGASDTGKSTFSHWLARRLAGRSPDGCALLDGDPGQSTLGPPTTVTLEVLAAEESGYPRAGRAWRRFVGSTSASRHMLPLIVAVTRLVEAARAAGCASIVHDTTGLVGTELGGLALKLAKTDLLRPRFVVTLEHEDELETLRSALAVRERIRVVKLPASSAARSRTRTERQRYRARALTRYFGFSKPERVPRGCTILTHGRLLRRHQLVALEDREGFVLALGIVLPSRAADGLVVRTPLADLQTADVVEPADLLVDPRTYRDEALFD